MLIRGSGTVLTFLVPEEAEGKRPAGIPSCGGGSRVLPVCSGGCP
jgi:hypothetical protein